LFFFNQSISIAKILWELPLEIREILIVSRMKTLKSGVEFGNKKNRAINPVLF